MATNKLLIVRGTLFVWAVIFNSVNTAPLTTTSPGQGAEQKKPEFVTVINIVTSVNEEPESTTALSFSKSARLDEALTTTEMPTTVSEESTDLPTTTKIPAIKETSTTTLSPTTVPTTTSSEEAKTTVTTSTTTTESVQVNATDAPTTTTNKATEEVNETTTTSLTTNEETVEPKETTTTIAPVTSTLDSKESVPTEKTLEARSANTRDDTLATKIHVVTEISESVGTTTSSDIKTEIATETATDIPPAITTGIPSKEVDPLAVAPSGEFKFESVEKDVSTTTTESQEDVTVGGKQDREIEPPTTQSSDEVTSQETVNSEIKDTTISTTTTQAPTSTVRLTEGPQQSSTEASLEYSEEIVRVYATTISPNRLSRKDESDVTTTELPSTTETDSTSTTALPESESTTLSQTEEPTTLSSETTTEEFESTTTELPLHFDNPTTSINPELTTIIRNPRKLNNAETEDNARDGKGMKKESSEATTEDSSEESSEEKDHEKTTSTTTTVIPIKTEEDSREDTSSGEKVATITTTTIPVTKKDQESSEEDSSEERDLAKASSNRTGNQFIEVLMVMDPTTTLLPTTRKEVEETTIVPNQSSTETISLPTTTEEIVTIIASTNSFSTEIDPTTEISSEATKQEITEAAVITAATVAPTEITTVEVEAANLTVSTAEEVPTTISDITSEATKDATTISQPSTTSVEEATTTVGPVENLSEVATTTSSSSEEATTTVTSTENQSEVATTTSSSSEEATTTVASTENLSEVATTTSSSSEEVESSITTTTATNSSSEDSTKTTEVSLDKEETTTTEAPLVFSEGVEDIEVAAIEKAQREPKRLQDPNDFGRENLSEEVSVEDSSNEENSKIETAPEEEILGQPDLDLPPVEASEERVNEQPPYPIMISVPVITPEGNIENVSLLELPGNTNTYVPEGAPIAYDNESLNARKEAVEERETDNIDVSNPIAPLEQEEPEITEDCNLPCNEIDPTEAPVCGTDGEVYISTCHLRRISCMFRTNTTVGPWELCRGKHYLCPSDCLNIYDPVCGNDYRIYRNLCHMRMRNCGKKMEAQDLKICYSRAKEFRNYQPCPDSCFQEFNPTPVCGSDGILYMSECTLRQKTCGQDIQVVELSRCLQSQQCPDFCLPLPDPTCGSDGKLYLNYCRLRQETRCQGVTRKPRRYCDHLRLRQLSGQT